MSTDMVRRERNWLLIGFVALAGALLCASASPVVTGGPQAYAQINQLQVSAGGPYSGQVGQTIVFSAQVFFGGAQASGVQYQWNFGDGTTGVGQTTSHVYTRAGTFTVIVGVATATGQSGSATTTAQIGSTQIGQLQVSAGGPYSGQVGLPITFTAQLLSGVQQFGTPVAQYQWSFGDGTTGTGQTTTHTYATAGTFTVIVGVTTANGQSGSATTSATVGGSATTATTAASSTTTTSTATEQVILSPGCNNVAVTWPNGTAISTVAAAVNPGGALTAIWFFVNTEQRYAGFSPVPGAPNDLTTVNRGAPVFVCVNAAATLTRPLI